jgi:16S rRNA (uracil1498-N3)-methyltransferase
VSGRRQPGDPAGGSTDGGETRPARTEATTERLHVADDLGPGARVRIDGAQAHYLTHVMRRRVGEAVLLFNGRHGEWRATLAEIAKRHVTLAVEARTRAQTDGPDVAYLFAPLKHARLDYMVQKATEMGVCRLQPVITRRTIAERVNLDRMRANAIEAAEQCGVLRVPDVGDPLPLARAVATLEPHRRLVVCDESAPSASPVAALTALAPGPVAVVVGPEGGFDPAERTALLAHPAVVAISLGPRIVRADTAAVAALALVNATLGRGW